jgi:hypothetical protein
MIDILLLRKDPTEVARRLAARGPGTFDAGQFQGFESARKNLHDQPERRIAYAARPLQDWSVPVVWLAA